MGKLTDILGDNGDDRLRKAWKETEAAQDFAPLPSGEYIARIIDGKLFTSRGKGTPGYKLTFQVLEGEYTNRIFWHDSWLTEAAMPMAKRDLEKIGVTSLDQLEKPIPPRIRCSVKLVIRKRDGDNENDPPVESNRVKNFEVLGRDELESDTFAPPEDDAESTSTGDEATDEPDDLPF